MNVVVPPGRGRDRGAEHGAVHDRDSRRPQPGGGSVAVIQIGSPGVQRSLFRLVTRPTGLLAAADRLRACRAADLPGDRAGHPAHPAPGQWLGDALRDGAGPGTCAHLTLKFGTMVTLTNPATGAVARCRVADRGPRPGPGTSSTWRPTCSGASPPSARASCASTSSTEPASARSPAGSASMSPCPC